MSAEGLPEISPETRVTATQAAIIGSFVIFLIAALYVGRPVLLPITTAFIIGTMLGPIVRGAARLHISPWLTAVALGLGLVAIVGTAVDLAAKPLSDWIARGPEIGEALRQKLYVLDAPLSALRELRQALLPENEKAVAVESSQLGIITPVIAYVTPTVVEFVLFFVTLIFFLAEQLYFRRYAVTLFASRDAKLRFLRIANEVERNLASYLATVTVINVGVGICVALGTWLFGFSNPVILGLMATVLNYIPYIGPAIMLFILFGVGIVTFPHLGYALLPPASFLGLTTLEGQFLTPTVLGHRLTVNPLGVLLALAFWAWIWGPFGAFLAVPITIVIVATLDHLIDSEEIKLPE